MPTFRCPAECRDCGTMSNPRDGARLPPAIMLDAIDQAAGAGYDAVVFTGGEPTLAGHDLDRAIERATARGLTTRVVTNAHWARTLRAARRRVGQLMAVGLTEINLSTGDEHARFVPIRNIVGAAT